MTADQSDIRSDGASTAAQKVILSPLVRRSAQAQSRADQVAAQLAEVIAKRKPRERLGTKKELQAQAGVSIGTFNETLRILQSKGLIELRPGPNGGLFTAERSPMAQLGDAVLELDINAASVAEAMDIRDALDPLLIEDAVRHSSERHIELMREDLDRMAAAVSSEDGIAFLRANWKLHATISDVSPRPMLKAFYVSLLNLIEEHTIAIASAAMERPLAGFHQERYIIHSCLVEAIAARDLKSALELSSKHNRGIARPSS
ncbi:FCD domain-containing protein [Nocardia sp. R6R-6]|uniref:FCD domain-containing protein n=1 Tax=Nocardia sp. R6R-6 TaxID=3459303 RepID=UPI00403DBDD6